MSWNSSGSEKAGSGARKEEAAVAEAPQFGREKLNNTIKGGGDAHGNDALTIGKWRGVHVEEWDTSALQLEGGHSEKSDEF